uniref:Fibronectin type-III domain-containing protein n=1 Tax=Hippocampus comes TaxID=109280 RepID=A0A3Q2Y1R2_HIPCM
ALKRLPRLPFLFYFFLYFLAGSGPLFGGCQVFDDSLGHVRVDLASPFLLGSDLRVYCHINKCGSSIMANNMHFSVMKGPPDKPENITCETTSPSPWVECRWRAGRDTHVVTSYKVSLSSENGTWNWTSEADNVVLPKAKLDVNRRYRLVVSADNRFGRSRSDPFMGLPSPAVLPQSPHITQVYFGNSSTLAAVLRWGTPEDLSQLSASVRLRPANSSSWEVREATRLSQDEVRVDGLEPLVDYQFQIRMCTTGTSKCSKWSSEVMSRSPGKGPTQPLRVWRILSNHKSSSLQTVSVLWKAPPPETFSGQVEHYKIDLGRGPAVREVICATSLCRFPLQVPSDLAALAVSVVTTYGTSPPAIVPLSLSGTHPTRGYPTANGSAMLVSWELTRPRVPGSEELYYVLEWTSVPAGHRELGWMQVSMDQNNATITARRPPSWPTQDNSVIHFCIHFCLFLLMFFK